MYNGSDGFFASLGAFALVYLAIILLYVVAMWKVFEKAGKPGWASLIPIYNLVVLMEIAGKETWWVILCFIPLVNIIIIIAVNIAISEKFGQSAGFGLGMVFLGFIFWPMLAFGDYKYQG
jgi:magnesium-transporting ATPase (P-type)